MHKDARTTPFEAFKERIVDASLKLAATRPWNEIALADIARAAHAPMEDLYGPLGSKDAIEQAIEERFDRAAAMDEDEPPIFTEPTAPPPAEEPDAQTGAGEAGEDGEQAGKKATGKEAGAWGGASGPGGPSAARLAIFETVMRRLEAMQDHRAAVLSIHRARRGSVSGRLRASAYALRSARWMLEASGAPTGGEAGAARVAGFARIWARAVRNWTRETSPDLNITMAGLDRDLRDAEDAIRNWRRRLARRGGGRGGAGKTAEKTGAQSPGESADPHPGDAAAKA